MIQTARSKLKSYNSDGQVTGTTPIKTFEVRYGEPGYGKMEAIYLPLTFSGTFGYVFSISSLRVVDIDRNHTTALSFANHVVDGTKITEFFIPGTAKMIDNSHFKGCSKLVKLVIGEGFTQGFAGYTFSGTSSLKYICILGGKDQAEAIINATVTSNNGDFFNMELISYGDFCALEDKSGKYIIYDCSPCFAFDNDVHSYSEDVTASVQSYFSTITLNSTCTVDGCTAKGKVGEIAPIFEWKGYSACTFGEGLSVVQGYTVNQAAINEYLAYAPDFDFGVLATVNNSGSAIAPKIGDANVITGEFVKDANDYLDIKITGIPADKGDALVVFCVYVTVGEDMFYLDGDKCANTVIGASYNQIAG